MSSSSPPTPSHLTDPSTPNSSTPRIKFSTKHFNPTLTSSPIVRDGAVHVYQYTSKFSSALSLKALLILLPVSWILGFYNQTSLQFEFRDLGLSKSPELKQPSSDQKKWFDSNTTSDYIVSMQTIMKRFGPSIVLASLLFFRVITGDWISSLPILAAPESPDQSQSHGQMSELELKQLDRDHLQLSPNVLNSYSHFRRKNEESTWPSWIFSTIYRTWSTDHQENPLAFVSKRDASYKGESLLALCEAHVPISRPLTPKKEGSGTPSSVDNHLKVMSDGTIPLLVGSTLTNLEELLPFTYKQDNPLKTRLYKYGLTKQSVDDFLRYKRDPTSTGNEKRCKALLLELFEKTRAVIGTVPTSYWSKMSGNASASGCSGKIRIETEDRYAATAAPAISYLCFTKNLNLVGDLTGDNIERVVTALVDLTTRENGTLMNSLLSFCSLTHESPVTCVIVEESLANVSTFSSALIHLSKRIWASKYAQLVENDSTMFGGSGRGLVPVTIDQSKSDEEVRGARIFNLIVLGDTSLSVSLGILYSLKNLLTQLSSNVVSHIDNIIDFEKLGTYNLFECAIKGKHMTGLGIGQVANDLVKHAESLLTSVFGDVDKLADVDLSYFIKGAFHLELNDMKSGSKKAMTFSYQPRSKVVTSVELDEIALKHFATLSPKEAQSKCNAFIGALNCAQAIVGLTTVNRSSEFNKIVLSDSAGGIERQFRGFDNIRDEVYFDPLLMLYRDTKKFNKDRQSASCLSPVHSLFNRPLLILGCLRKSFAYLVQRTKGEREIRSEIFDYLFLDSDARVIPDGSPWSLRNFNSHVEHAVRNLNSRLNEEAQIDVFTQSDLRHFNESLLSHCTRTLAEEDKYNNVAMGVVDDKFFNHSTTTGKNYATDGRATNETSASITSAEFELVRTTAGRYWKYLGLPEFRNQHNRLPVKLPSFRHLLELPQNAKVEDINSRTTTQLLHGDFLRRALGKPIGFGATWRSVLQAEGIASAMVNDICTFTPLHDIACYLETGAGKTNNSFVPALFFQTVMQKEACQITVLVVHRTDLAANAMARAVDCGIRAAKWESGTMDRIMQQIRSGMQFSLLVAVVDSFNSPQSLKHIKLLHQMRKVVRITIDEAHAYPADQEFRSEMKRFAAAFGNSSSVLSQLSITYLSATMTPQLELSMLSMFNRKKSLKHRVVGSPFQNAKVRYVFRNPSTEQELTTILINECLRSLNEKKKLLICFMTIKHCSQFKNYLTWKGITCAVNNSEAKSNDPDHGTNMSSWLGDEKDSKLIMISTMPLAGVDPKRLETIIVCGSYSIIDLKQSFGRGRDACTAVFLATSNSTKYLRKLIACDLRKHTTIDNRPEVCKPQGVLSLVESLESKSCFRRELLQVTLVEPVEGVDIYDLECKAIRTLDPNTVLCSNCSPKFVWPPVKALSASESAFNACRDYSTFLVNEAASAAAAAAKAPDSMPPPQRVNPNPYATQPVPSMMNADFDRENRPAPTKAPVIQNSPNSLSLTNYYLKRSFESSQSPTQLMNENENESPRKSPHLIRSSEGSSGCNSDAHKQLVYHSYKEALRLVKGRETSLPSVKCVFCDNAYCLSDCPTDLCPVFDKEAAKWSDASRRCMRCSGVGHWSRDCPLSYRMYYSVLCMDCLSPNCSRDQTARSCPHFQEFKMPCSRPTSFSKILANRAMCVVNFIARNSEAHKQFVAHLKVTYRDMNEIPPFSSSRIDFHEWCFKPVFKGDAILGHILNWSLVLRFWLSRKKGVGLCRE